ncbi:hypothetical protein [Methylobacterium sp. R2-1]|uniref:hypothetical protein n=1 Tax=Methylobacterium sp. R2-1 TaxID=2587064 RepID=UPI00160912CD|nr:hypothetical protein [Methylobacterium sp. R2-1]MBB2965170.1 hypothetical protein [Methylobacterium sp. R2-1]
MPLIETSLVWGALEAGAVISASEVVKLVTKDAYTAVKEKAAEIWGRPATRAIAQVEANPGSAEAKAALHAAIPAVDDADAPELGPVLEALADALKADDAARAEADRAQVRFDLDLGGSAIIGKVQNAESFDAKVKAKGDFKLDELTMAERGRSGNS